MLNFIVSLVCYGLLKGVLNIDFKMLIYRFLFLFYGRLELLYVVIYFDFIFYILEMKENIFYGVINYIECL